MSCSKCGVTINVDSRSKEYCLFPRLDISTSPTNVPHLTRSDVEHHMPNDINFNYYSSHEFHDNQEIIHCLSERNSFSVLNCNIRSLAKNFDNFHNMLNELDAEFSVIGLTEIKLKFNQDPIINCNLPGYKFISQPSYSNSGGVGFFIKDNLKFRIRNDLTASKDEFEAIWIEIEGNNKQNMTCGLVYRHPNGDLDSFQNYLNSAIDKIHRQNKQCIVMVISIWIFLNLNLMLALMNS